MKIRSDILRIYQALHTWVGIGAGMLLFIGFLGGALTMFKQPLERWISQPALAQRAVPEAQLDTLVRQLLAQHPAARREFTLDLTRHENVAAPVSWRAGGGGRELDLAAPLWHATLDASGRLAARQEVPSLLAELIDMLHRTAGIPGMLGGDYLGGYVMGVAGVMYFLALASGLVLLLPTLVKDFFALRAGKNRKRFWRDAHNLVGIASLPFHVVISLTVIVFAFHDQFYGGLARLVYGERPMFGAPPARLAAPHALGQMLPVTALVARVRREALGFELTGMRFMGLDGARPTVRAALENPRHLVHGPLAAYVMIDPFTGATDAGMLPGRESTWVGLVTPFFALHFGSYGGNLVRWVYFLLGLGGAFLFYSGNLLWLEKRRKNQLRGQATPGQTRATRLMASATVGVCLGCVAGICAAMVAGKWLPATVVNINSAYLAAYYGAFLAALGWAFWRGAARAAPQLLRLCALGALAIPLSSLLGWANTSPAALGVDLTALLAALLLAGAARLSARRAAHGAPDSVWAA